MGITDWKFKKGLDEIGGSDGFWYNITDGGYIKPELILSDKKQIEKVLKAVAVLQDFEKALMANGIISDGWY